VSRGRRTGMVSTKYYSLGISREKPDVMYSINVALKGFKVAGEDHCL
jgi:hypothetical protein